MDAHSTYFKLSGFFGVSIINISQVQFRSFLIFMVSYALVVGREVQAVKGSLSPPPPHLHNLSYDLVTHSPYYKLSECEKLSIIIIIQFKFSCVPGCTDLYT